MILYRFVFIPISGFHLSGVVWTYPPSSSDLFSTNTSTNSNNNTTSNGNNGNIVAAPAGPGLIVAAVNVGAAGNVGVQPIRLSSAERDANANNGSANYPIEENKKYKVSVSFDR